MEGVGVTTVMVGTQCLEVGLNTLVKAASSNGMSEFVFIVYSNLIALSLLLPSSFFYYYYYKTNTPSPSLTASIISKIFLLSFLSCGVQTLTYTGIAYSSPTLASAMVDLTPAFTFILAIISRYERVEWKVRSSMAKCVGTMVCIVGAFMMTLYKQRRKLANWYNNLQEESVEVEWLVGGLLLSLSAFCLSLLFIVKTWIIKEYPKVLMVTTISCGFVVVISTIVALFAENNAKAWILRPDMELVSIFYSAIFMVSMRNIVHIWACGKKGPLYVAMFTPFGMVIALVMGILFLGDTLCLGSVIGGGIIAIGFYGVVWGKSQEEKIINERKEISNFVSSSSSSVTPLLHKHNIPKSQV